MPAPTRKAASTGTVSPTPTAPPGSCDAAKGEPPGPALTLSTTRTYSSSMSETYTSAFAGAGTARHRSCTMTVDRPGRRGRTCRRTWAQLWPLPTAPHPRRPTATRDPRPGAAGVDEGLPDPQAGLSSLHHEPLPAGLGCRRAGLGLRKRRKHKPPRGGRARPWGTQQRRGRRRTQVQESVASVQAAGPLDAPPLPRTQGGRKPPGQGAEAAAEAGQRSERTNTSERCPPACHCQ